MPLIVKKWYFIDGMLFVIVFLVKTVIYESDTKIHFSYAYGRYKFCFFIWRKAGQIRPVREVQ